MNEFYLTANDGFKISVAYFPVENPKMLVQIVHGALEHKERYYDLISYFNKCGYSCIVSDNRGHGHSIDKKYIRGYMDNYPEMIDDLVIVSNYIKSKNKNVKLAMLGQSMGSMLARLYLADNDASISKLILTGTANWKPIAKCGIYLCKLIEKLKGPYGYSKMLDNISGINKPKEKWISYNKDNIKAIYEDNLYTKRFTIRGNTTIGMMCRDLNEISMYKCKNKNLLILSLNGIDDPITGKKAGLKKSESILRQIGYKNVKFEILDNMMHEVLQETNKELVWNKINTFLNE